MDNIAAIPLIFMNKGTIKLFLALYESHRCISQVHRNKFIRYFRILERKWSWVLSRLSSVLENHRFLSILGGFRFFSLPNKSYLLQAFCQAIGRLFPYLPHR